MPVHYRDSKDVDLFQLAKLFADSGAGEPASDITRLGQVIRGSASVAWASEHGKVVGFASALTDGALSGVVTHVVVHADCQGRGIEEALVDRIVKAHKGVVFAMRATAATGPFCATLGFKPDALWYTRKA